MAEYAGDISVREAWEVLSRETDAVLVDVRTLPEWQFVGVPDLSAFGKKPVLVSWQVYPMMQRNEAFEEAVRGNVNSLDAPLLFLCRSGARSRAAAIAMTAAGYRRCHNVAGGFEGALDAGRHRATPGSWKADGLPWVQE